jgi:hypothetical protein
VSAIRARIATAWPGPVRLSLPEMAALLEAGLDTGGADPGEGDLYRACSKLEAAKMRRERAVRRAAGRGTVIQEAG